MESDPYIAPQAAPSIDPVSVPVLGELVKSWEKLRLIYNAVLLLAGIAALYAASVNLTPSDAANTILLSATAANAAFFLGPLAELYLRVIFFRSKPARVLRLVIFVSGLLVSLAVMAVLTLEEAFPEEVGWAGEVGY